MRINHSMNHTISKSERDLDGFFNDKLTYLFRCKIKVLDGIFNDKLTYIFRCKIKVFKILYIYIIHRIL